MARPSKYPDELRERAVRMVAEVRPQYPSQWAAITAVAGMLGIGTPETLWTWIRRSEVDTGQRAGVPPTIQTGKLNPAVEQWLADEEVRTALEKRDRAYRSRDFAFATLWRLAKLHHPDDHHDGRCSCGRHEDTCKELQAISPELGMLRRWEETQIERLDDQLEHGLPDDHPAVMRSGGSYLRRGRHLA